MADDIFLSPEEQDERARKWLKDNGPALAIGIVLGLAGIFGFEQYRDHRQAKSEEASSLYQSVLEESADSQLSDFQSQIDTLKADHASSSYAAKAVLIRAKQLSATDLDAAFEELAWVIDNAQENGVKHAARIRQAKILFSQGNLDEAQALASFEPNIGFESHYAELLGDIAVQQGEFDVARQNYKRAIDEIGQAGGGYSQLLQLKLDRLPVSEEPVDEGEGA